MNEEKTINVAMNPEERAEYEAFKQERDRKAREEKRKTDMEAYRKIVSDLVNEAIPELESLSEQIQTVKKTVADNFRQAIDMKTDLLNIRKENQRSDTFINEQGNKRITLGVYVTDAYSDTVEDGIQIVREWIESKVKDDDTRALAAMVTRLLSRDTKGTLKASRIVQLRNIANEVGDRRLQEGVSIIENSYTPNVSRQYLRAEIKTETGAWRPIPLGMTEA